MFEGNEPIERIDPGEWVPGEVDPDEWEPVSLAELISVGEWDFPDVVDEAARCDGRVWWRRR